MATAGRAPEASRGPIGGQPPITPGSELLSTDWLPGPEDGTDSAVVVSFTDFWAATDEDLGQIIRTGLHLSKRWPTMRGAVGLWLWGKPNELRGGSLAVWTSAADLRRFIHSAAHLAIVDKWRPRIEVRSERWEDPSFNAEEAWTRAERYMRRVRESQTPPRAAA
jgi:hypothetical protein